MNSGKSIFAQLMEFLPIYEFRKCVKRYNGNYKIKSFTCWEQFLCMSFAQLTYRESLRDIEACLRAAHKKLYHMGIRSKGYPAIHWQMQTKSVTGAYTQTLHRRLSALQESFISTKISALNCNKLHMHWMPRLLIYVCLCSHGQNFVIAKEQSSCIRS